MRVSIDKTTGLIIEYQSHARKGTLTENALSSGFTNILEKEVTEEELQILLKEKEEKRQKTKEELNFITFKALEELDKKSIRAIREYISSKPDAPQILKDKEIEAQVERAKIKK